VREPDGEAAAALGELRTTIESYPRHAALKRIVARRGVPIREDVRRPLRALTPEERAALDAWDAAMAEPAEPGADPDSQGARRTRYGAGTHGGVSEA
jgi:hypothetical protein